MVLKQSKHSPEDKIPWHVLCVIENRTELPRRQVCCDSSVCVCIAESASGAATRQGHLEKWGQETKTVHRELSGISQKPELRLLLSLWGERPQINSTGIDPRSWSSVLWVLEGARGKRKSIDLFIISQHHLTLKGHSRNSEWHSDSSKTTINKGQVSGKSMTEFPLTLSYLCIFKKGAMATAENRSPFGRLIVLQFISNGSMSVQHSLHCFYD